MSFLIPASHSPSHSRQNLSACKGLLTLTARLTPPLLPSSAQATSVPLLFRLRAFEFAENYA